MTPRPATVRPAVASDADALWPLAHAFAVSFAPERAAFERTLPELLGRDDTLLVVAEADGLVIGYLLASVHLTFLANGPVAWVEEVMVEAGSRREGAGSALMAAAEMWAADRGAAYVSLASRRAADFYLALGYDDSAVYFRKGL